MSATITQFDMSMPEQTERAETVQSSETESTLDAVEILAVFWSSRKLIAYITGGVTLLSIVISLILPESYKSTATILPETDKGKLSALGGFSDLASLAGVNVGGEASLGKLYPTILKSEAVLKNVILSHYKTDKSKDSVNLIEFWGIVEKDPGSALFDALTALRNQLDVAMDVKTSVITISIETTDKQLSADLINTVLASLDKFVRTKRTTNASEQRKFVEARLAEVKEDLSRSENNLKEFREKNLQVRSPQLQLDEGRLLREVQINSTIFTELKKQYEIVKIEEVKNLPVINILDKATPAIYRERPKKTMMVITWFVISLLAALAFAVGQHRFGQDVLDFVSKIRTRTK